MIKYPFKVKKYVYSRYYTNSHPNSYINPLNPLYLYSTTHISWQDLIICYYNSIKFPYIRWFQKFYSWFSTEISSEDWKYMEIYKAEWCNRQKYLGVWVILLYAIIVSIVFGGYITLSCRPPNFIFKIWLEC